jgi:WD40 repeat protein
LFNTQNGKLFHSLSCVSATGASSSVQGEDQTVESIAFSPPETGLDYLACGTVRGNIVVFDVATMSERFRILQDFGLTKLLWDPKLPLIYTAGLDGVIRVLDVQTCKIERKLGRHRTEILDFCVTKDGSKIASASDDGSVFIYNLLES